MWLIFHSLDVSARIEKIVVSADPTPDALNTFTTIYPQADINNLGQVVFVADIQNQSQFVEDDLTGLYFADPQNNIRLLFQQNQILPFSNQSRLFHKFTDPRLSADEDLIVFTVKPTRFFNEINADTIMRFDVGDNDLRQLAAVGQVIGDGMTYSELHAGYRPNNDGIVLYNARLSQLGDSNITGAFRTHGQNQYVHAIPGTGTPDAAHLFDNVRNIQINQTGSSIFCADAHTAANANIYINGLYRADPIDGADTLAINTLAINKVVQSNDFLDDGINRINEVKCIASINNSGHIVYVATINNGFYQVVVYFDGDRHFELLRSNNATPQRPGYYSEFMQLYLDEHNRVTFLAKLTNGEQGIYQIFGIDVVANGRGAVKQMARQGDIIQLHRRPLANPAAEVYGPFESMHVNRHGHIALSAAGNDPNGIFSKAVYIITDDGLVINPLNAATELHAGHHAQDFTVFPMSDHDQLLIFSTFADRTQGLFHYTPTLYFTAATDMDWNLAANWDLGFVPEVLHDVIIAPPGDSSAFSLPQSLTLQGMQLGTPDLPLQLIVGEQHELTINAIRVEAGSKLTTMNAAIEAGNLVNHGEIAGHGLIHARLINSGLLNPGNPTGKFIITGSLTLDAGSVLAMDINGSPASNAFDVISVEGISRLTGELRVQLDGYEPAGGDNFVLLRSRNMVGSFETVTLPASQVPLRLIYGRDGADQVVSISAGANTAPKAGNKIFSVTGRAELTGFLPATDDEFDSLTFTVTTKPGPGVDFSLTDAATGAFSFRNLADDTGSKIIEFTVSDGEFVSQTGIVTIRTQKGPSPTPSPPPRKNTRPTGGGALSLWIVLIYLPVLITVFIRRRVQ